PSLLARLLRQAKRACGYRRSGWFLHKADARGGGAHDGIESRILARAGGTLPGEQPPFSAYPLRRRIRPRRHRPRRLRPRYPARRPRPAFPPARRPVAERFTEFDGRRDRASYQWDRTTRDLQAVPGDVPHRPVAGAAAANSSAAVVAERPRPAPALVANAASACRLPSAAAWPCSRGVPADHQD